MGVDHTEAFPEPVSDGQVGLCYLLGCPKHQLQAEGPQLSLSELGATSRRPTRKRLSSEYVHRGLDSCPNSDVGLAFLETTFLLMKRKSWKATEASRN